MKRLRTLAVFGTRPEAIKMAPVVHALRAHPEKYEAEVCVTAQHRQLLDQVLEAFDIRPDVDLDLMTPKQSLFDITTRVLTGMQEIFARRQYDLVLVHGDTTTTAAASLAAFYCRIPVGHVEAGLRTRDKYSPFPEEINRRIAGVVADLHFVPTDVARNNLLSESVPAEQIFVTGNTAIDAVRFAQARLGLTGQPERRTILVTAHRRENFGAGIENICRALRQVAASHPEVEIRYPVHPNPNIVEPVHRFLNGLDNVKLLPPQDYLDFVRELSNAYFVVSDSGGIQEEAPALGKPVLVLRDTTERPEAISAGTARLTGTRMNDIVEDIEMLLTDRAAYDAMATRKNPYGDGTAAKKIEAAVAQWSAQRGAQAVYASR